MDRGSGVKERGSWVVTGNKRSRYGPNTKRGVNRGMEGRRTVLFCDPNLSIRRHFRSNPDPHYVKASCGIRLLQ